MINTESHSQQVKLAFFPLKAGYIVSKTLLLKNADTLIFLAKNLKILQPHYGK